MKYLLPVLTLAGLSVLGCDPTSPLPPEQALAGSTCVLCPPDEGGDPADPPSPGGIVHVDGKPYSAFYPGNPPAWGAEAEWTRAEADFVDSYGSFQLHGTFRYDGTDIRTEATVALSNGTSGAHPRRAWHEFALEGELSTFNTYMNAGCDLAGNVFFVGTSEICIASLPDLGILKLDEESDDAQDNAFFGCDGGAGGGGDDGGGPCEGSLQASGRLASDCDDGQTKYCHYTVYYDDDGFISDVVKDYCWWE